MNICTWSWSFYFIKKIFLQCCVGFCRTTMQISHNYTYMPHVSSLPPVPPSLQVSQRSRQCCICYTAPFHKLPISHLIKYMCWCYFLHLSHSLPPPLYSQVHFLHLHLHSFPAIRFINTIFLDSRYLPTFWLGYLASCRFINCFYLLDLANWID